MYLLEGPLSKTYIYPKDLSIYRNWYELKEAINKRNKRYKKYCINIS